MRNTIGFIVRVLGSLAAFVCLLLDSQIAFGADDNRALIDQWHQEQSEKRMAADRLDLPRRRGLLLQDLHLRLMSDSHNRRNDRLQATADEWCSTFKACSPLIQGSVAIFALYSASEMLPNTVSSRRSLPLATAGVDDPIVALRKRVAIQIIETIVDAANSNDWLQDPKFGPQLSRIAQSNVLSGDAQTAALKAASKHFPEPDPIYEQTLKAGEAEVQKIRDSILTTAVDLPCSQRVKDANARLYSLLREKKLIDADYVAKDPNGYLQKHLDDEQSARMRTILNSLAATFPKLSDSEKAYFYARTVTVVGALMATDIEVAAAPFYSQLLDAVRLDWPQYNANSTALLGGSAALCPGRLKLGIKAYEKALELARFGDPNLGSDANWTQALGYLYVLDDDFENAKACFEHAKQAESEMPDFLDSLKSRNIATYDAWLQVLSSAPSKGECSSEILVASPSKKKHRRGAQKK